MILFGGQPFTVYTYRCKARPSECEGALVCVYVIGNMCKLDFPSRDTNLRVHTSWSRPATAANRRK